MSDNTTSSAPVKVDGTSPLIVFSCPANSSVSEIDQELALPPTNYSASSNTSSNATTAPITPMNTGWTGSNGQLTTTEPCIATFTFVGAQLQVTGSSSYDYGVYGCSIDGLASVWFNGWMNAPADSVNLCSIDGLSGSDNHTFVLTNGPMPGWALTFEYLTYSTADVVNSTGVFTSTNPAYDLDSTIYKPIPTTFQSWHPYYKWYWGLSIVAVLELVALVWVHCGSVEKIKGLFSKQKGSKGRKKRGEDAEKSLKKGTRGKKGVSTDSESSSGGESSDDGKK